MMISGKARVAAATPAVFRKSRRDQPDLILFPCVIAGTPPVRFNVGPPENPILRPFGLITMYLAELHRRTQPIAGNAVRLRRTTAPR